MSDDDKPALIKGESHRAVYINSSLMGFSAWDIQMTLWNASGPGSGTSLEEQITVIQSPTHAKAMLRSLATTVAAYEEKYGAIPEVSTKRDSVKAETDKPIRSKRPARRLPTVEG